MNTTMLKEKSIRHIKVQDYNIIKIPVVYDDKLIIYNMEILDREKLSDLINEIRDNNLSDSTTCCGILDYDTYTKYIREMMEKYKLTHPQEKIKNGIIKYEMNISRLPKIYNILKELFGFYSQRSLETLSDYLTDLKNYVTTNNNSPLQVEFDNSTSILNAIREISEYIVLRDQEEYSDIEKIESENYDSETMQDFITIGKVNKNCIETGIFEILKIKNKTKIKLDN